MLNIFQLDGVFLKELPNDLPNFDTVFVKYIEILPQKEDLEHYYSTGEYPLCRRVLKYARLSQMLSYVISIHNNYNSYRQGINEMGIAEVPFCSCNFWLYSKSLEPFLSIWRQRNVRRTNQLYYCRVTPFSSVHSLGGVTIMHYILYQEYFSTSPEKSLLNL